MLEIFKKNKKVKIYLFITLYSFVLLLFCTKSSPLYLFNDWTDAQIYFTLGKGIFNGKVLYRDLFDHKGPLIFFLFGIASRISSSNFLGVYILQAIGLSVSLIYCYKISNLYLDNKNSILVVAIYSSIFVFRRVINLGGTAEEFMVPFQVVSLYYFILYFKDKKREYTNRTMIVHGIVFSAIFFIKFNLVVLNCIFLFVIFLELLIKKQYKEFFKYLFYFFVGFCIVAIPIIIYFLFNNALSYLIHNYFILNIKYLDRKEGLYFTILQIIKGIGLIYHRSRINFIIFIFAVSSIFAFSFYDKYTGKKGKFIYIISVFLTIISVYSIGDARNYFILSLVPYTIFFIIVVVKFLGRFIKGKIAVSIVLCLIAIVSVFFNKHIFDSIILNNDTSYMQKDFAEAILADKDQSLIYYGCLDQGVHLSSNTLPSVRYYQNVNFGYSQLPEMYDNQNKNIANKEVRFVVTYEKKSHDKILNENYDLLMIRYNNAHEKKKVYLFRSKE